MTGRDLIIYILQNNLEDEPVFIDEAFLGFLTLDQAAVRLNVGSATIKTWAELGWLDYIRLGDKLYFPANIKTPELERKD